MSYEVELKFAIRDLPQLERGLATRGARFGSPVEQIDRYFAHPGRDFAQTDEALRIRRVGNENHITYKGPKLDVETKTRREIELPLADGAEHLSGFTSLLLALGFSVVAEVHKTRRSANLPWRGGEVTVALDDVTGVGPFVELEILADVDELDTARASLLAFATDLGLKNSERRSYLELLLGRSN